MDPVALVVTALAAGANRGLMETASAAICDAYSHLKALAAKRLHGRPDGDLALTQFTEETSTWEETLITELTAAGAESDHVLLAAAQAFLRLTDEAGCRSGKYHVDARGAQGVQAGDRNTQHNSFGGGSVGY